MYTERSATAVVPIYPWLSPALLQSSSQFIVQKFYELLTGTEMKALWWIFKVEMLASRHCVYLSRNLWGERRIYEVNILAEDDSLYWFHMDS